MFVEIARTTNIWEYFTYRLKSSCNAFLHGLMKSRRNKFVQICPWESPIVHLRLSFVLQCISCWFSYFKSTNTNLFSWLLKEFLISMRVIKYIFHSFLHKSAGYLTRKQDTTLNYVCAIQKIEQLEAVERRNIDNRLQAATNASYKKISVEN